MRTTLDINLCDKPPFDARAIGFDDIKRELSYALAIAVPLIANNTTNNVRLSNVSYHSAR